MSFYFRTGFEKLDEELDGGLQAGLCFVTGYKNVGKTLFVDNVIIENVKRGIGATVLSFNLPAAEKLCNIEYLIEKKKDWKNMKKIY